APLTRGAERDCGPLARLIVACVDLDFTRFHVEPRPCVVQRESTNGATTGLDCAKFGNIISGIVSTRDEHAVTVIIDGISIICDNEQVWHTRNVSQSNTIVTCTLY